MMIGLLNIPCHLRSFSHTVASMLCSAKPCKASTSLRRTLYICAEQPIANDVKQCTTPLTCIIHDQVWLHLPQQPWQVLPHHPQVLLIPCACRQRNVEAAGREFPGEALLPAVNRKGEDRGVPCKDRGLWAGSGSRGREKLWDIA